MNELGQSTINPIPSSNELGQSTINPIPSFGYSNEMNELVKIYNAFPDKSWQWTMLSENPNISLEIIDLHIDKILNKNNHYYHYSKGVSGNPNLTMEYLYKHPFKKWKWEDVSSNPSFTLNDIETNKDIPWDWRGVAENPNIIMEFILKHVDKFTANNSGYLGSTPNITMQDVEKYPDLFMSKFRLSKNPNLTLDFVFAHPETNLNKWDWEYIGQNPNITFADVLNHQELTSNILFMTHFSKNYNVTIDIIKNNNNLKWYWAGLCQNPALTMEDLDSLNVGYDKSSMLNNPNLTLEWLIKYLDEGGQFVANYITKNKFKFHPYFNKPIVIRI